jgi:hypothetical protein
MGLNQATRPRKLWEITILKIRVPTHARHGGKHARSTHRQTERPVPTARIPENSSRPHFRRRAHLGVYERNDLINEIVFVSPGPNGVHVLTSTIAGEAIGEDHDGRFHGTRGDQFIEARLESRRKSPLVKQAESIPQIRCEHIDAGITPHGLILIARGKIDEHISLTRVSGGIVRKNLGLKGKRNHLRAHAAILRQALDPCLLDPCHSLASLRLWG